jgi:hypothetical protein
MDSSPHLAPKKQRHHTIPSGLTAAQLCCFACQWTAWFGAGGVQLIAPTPPHPTLTHHIPPTRTKTDKPVPVATLHRGSPRQRPPVQAPLWMPSCCACRWAARFKLEALSSPPHTHTPHPSCTLVDAQLLQLILELLGCDRNKWGAAAAAAAGQQGTRVPQVNPSQHTAAELHPRWPQSTVQPH